MSQVDELDETQITVPDLPLTFKVSLTNIGISFHSFTDCNLIFLQVKYLGSQFSRGLWGIKHTRRPVDYLVSL